MGRFPRTPGEGNKDDHDCRDDKGEGSAADRAFAILIILHPCAPVTSRENAAVAMMVPDSACSK
jgi:hypothetical protein